MLCHRTLDKPAKDAAVEDGETEMEGIALPIKHVVCLSTTSFYRNFFLVYLNYYIYFL